MGRIRLPERLIKGTAKKFKNIVKWSLFSAIFLFLLFLLLNLLFPLPDRIEYSTVVTGSRGEILHVFLTKDQQWRMKTELSELSPLLRKTIVEKEDKYFYDHPGVNPFAILRALVKNVLHMRRTSGASTITMQVARALEPRRRTYWAKCIEAFRAFQLEWKYSKDQILQLYVNLLPYGGNVQGVKTAAYLYFGKAPDHLSLAEITALAIIPNRPSSLRIGRDNAGIVRERNKWLRRFAADHVFSGKEIRDALSEPLIAGRGRMPAYIPHLAERLRVSEPGPLVRTPIRLNMQLTVQALADDYVGELRDRGVRQTSVIVIDNRTNQVVAYLGSHDFWDSASAGQVDGVRAVREPGSTLKPFLYGLCVDAGWLTPKMVLEDVPVDYDGYAPENYDRSFRGYVTMEYALEHSLNIPAVNCLRRLGKDKLIGVLSDCGFRQVGKDRNKLGLSMILGGCGTTLEELAGLYASLAHEGVYRPPLFVLGDTTHRDSIRVMSPAACFIIDDILSRVNRPDFPLNWQTTGHLPKIAWKTGTSYGRRDAWSIGFNGHFTVGVWLGNFSGRGVPDLSGASVATPLLFQIFNTIDYDNGQDWFRRPPSCQTRIVCSGSGLLPNTFCTNLVSDYYIPLVSTTQLCEDHIKIAVSPDERISYCKICMPRTGYKEKWYPVISPGMRAFFDEHHVAYEKIPPHNPNCESVFGGKGPAILSPAQGAEYYLSKKNPEPLRLLSRPSAEVGKVYWYINDAFFKSGDARTPQYFIPGEGPVKVSCTDDKGRNRDIWIRVHWVDL